MLMNPPHELELAACVGLDWADQRHVICLQATGCNNTESRPLEQKPDALHDWVAQLRTRFARPEILVLNPARPVCGQPQVYIIRNYVTVSAGDIGAIYGLTPLNRLSARLHPAFLLPPLQEEVHASRQQAQEFSLARDPPRRHRIQPSAHS